MPDIAISVSEALAMTDVEFAVETLRTQRNSALGRYIQFRAYAELVKFLENGDKLPSDFDAGFDLNDWIEGRSAPGSLKQKVLELLQRVKENSANSLSELCEFYCAHAAELKKLAKFGGLIGALSGVGALAAFHAYVAAFLVGFGPFAPAIFLVIAYLITEGAFDKLCDCG